MPEANKVHFGLKNVHVAKITYTNGVPSWGTPIHVPGAVSLTLSRNSAATDFYADDVKYFRLVSNNGYTGSLEMADFPNSIRGLIWNQEMSGSVGYHLEKAGVQPNEFALMFEIDGDKNPDRYCLMRCLADRPDINASTIGESPEVQTETAELTVMPVIDPTEGSTVNNVVLYAAKNGTSQERYDAFYDAVSNLEP